MRERRWAAMVLCALLGASGAAADEKVLFDFEKEADLKNWSQLKLADKTLRGADEPAVTIELSDQHATRGRKCLKLTFSGGKYPTVACAEVPRPEMWRGFKTFRADVHAPRTCAVVFRLMYEKSSRKFAWTPNGSRVVKIARCEKGKNEIVDYLRFHSSFEQHGRPASLEIYMLRPRKGESIYIDNIRLSSKRPDHTTPFRERNPHYVGEDLAKAARYPWYPMPKELKVLGEGLTVKSAKELKPGEPYYEFSPFKPTFFISMPVNRSWVEAEAGGFEWARDEFWKETCGMSWEGDDPDILPLIIGYGQTGVNVGEFDLTRAVGYLTSGERANNGFTLACPIGYINNNNVRTSETPVLKNRPAMMVIYEPKQ